MRSDFFLPPAYLFLSDAEAAARIRDHRRRHGRRLAIVAHAYQRAPLAPLADVVGDGVALARWAAAASSAIDRVVCASVRYVGVLVRLLVPSDGARVVATDPDAACPMADGVDPDAFRRALRWASARGTCAPVLSVTMPAPLLAAAARAGGSACGSSNAGRVLRWALDAADRALFVPDEALATHAAAVAGLAPADVLRWHDTLGAAADGSRARVLVLASPCPVHERLAPTHVETARAREPAVHVVVQPDAPPAVRRCADAVVAVGDLGRHLDGLPATVPVAVGTELQLVERLRAERPTLRLSALEATFCASHYTPSLASLLYTLDRLDDVPAVEVPVAEAVDARTALTRMLAVDR